MNTQDFTVTYNALKEFSDYATCAFVADETTENLTVITRSLFERIIIAVRNALYEFVKMISGVDYVQGFRETEKELLIKTVHRLDSHFGSARVIRALKSIGVNITFKERYGFLFTKREICDLFHQLACVTKQDFEELFTEIKHLQKPKRKISQEVWDNIRNLCDSVSCIKECSNAQLEKIHDLLIPFPSSKELFFNENPFSIINDTTPRSFSYFTMRQCIAQTVERMRQKNLSQTEWEFFFTKKLAQPEFQQELVVSHPKGYLYFQNEVNQAGTTKRLFAPLNTSDLPVHILYRGTRGSMPIDSIADIRTTIMEDRTNEIGTYGTIQSYEKTKNLFSNHRDITLLGYSLGGAHAQRDAIAFHTQVHRLVTVSSPGIDMKSAQLFATILQENPPRIPMEIVHASDEDDIVNAAGEAHLGTSCLNFCSIKLLSYAPAEGGVIAFNKISISHENIFSLLLLFNRTLHAHARPTSINKHVCTELSTENAEHHSHIEQILSHDERIYDPYLERLRQKIGFIVTPSFSEFIKEKLVSCKNPILELRGILS